MERERKDKICAIQIATGKAVLLLFCSTSTARGMEFFKMISRVGNWSNILTHF